jgi:hypothetical protein
VRDEYINAALEVITVKFRGMKKFLEKVLQADISKLQEIFLSK